ncbi:HIT family protein [Parapusillimonas granuli]|uniref:HIT family protein n=1 Tax=Parapusillimonas granuli TaxID=380911 RepID=A0A853FYD5_9BURK|nr:HIT family protein [Parapusillimonas granuli]MBB5215435.1 diadenosine tetraphosphate (Ap4A) HIT family hydrolase [Parapusillimonas granuli]MEB2400272.1 HIT family protein [Alcaligenaceae bacterium]NYT49898.1 HIT family protein [Parapusillimonas granuli]
MTAPGGCPLCLQPGGPVLWRNDAFRVLRVDDADYPGYTRVVWNAHVAEMTQLSSRERGEFMDAVWLVEQAQRGILRPDKINLAQFGNMVPHLHWHVIPRWRGDSRFPEAVWAPPVARGAAAQAGWNRQRGQLAELLPEYHAALIASLDLRWRPHGPA